MGVNDSSRVEYRFIGGEQVQETEKQDIGRNIIKDYDKSAVREYDSELQSSANEDRNSR